MEVDMIVVTNKLVLLYFFCMFAFYMTGCCFSYFTQMYCLRPSLKMLHEIFNHFLRMIFTPFLHSNFLQ